MFEVRKATGKRKKASLESIIAPYFMAKNISQNYLVLSLAKLPNSNYVLLVLERGHGPNQKKSLCIGQSSGLQLLQLALGQHKCEYPRYIMSAR
ncbi:hypothetical protein NC653_041966 [Populus alba x Populus x berolinensis]|uniref:Uncharacterized protein n=1 Tax=Populus alba x Populus x berolinensis TaxID=444605 RepID=A0AAD6PPU9_9ROSI|nr:hypothetical protein NC653_041966 [Populus alba x Populus x berolinensis]